MRPVSRAPAFSVAFLLLLAPRPWAETAPSDGAVPSVGAASPATAAPPVIAAKPEPFQSLRLGQPKYYRVEIGSMGGYAFRSEKPTGRFLVDLEGRVAAPQFGLLDVALEGTWQRVQHNSRTTFGASLKLPLVRTGLEYDTHDRKPYFKLTLEGAPRRGGLLSRGDRLRLDYTPARKVLEVGLKMPLPWSGYRATRPRNAHVALERGSLPEAAPVPPSLSAPDEMERVRHAMEWVDRMLTPNLTPRSPERRKGRQAFEREATALNEHARTQGHSFAAEEAAYHGGLRAAFAAAVGGDEALGEEVATRARHTLLRDVILPYDRLLGRIKRPGALGGLLATANADFHVGLEAADLQLGTAERQACQEVFRQVLQQLDRTTRAARKRWHSWRLVWIPLNFGLRPDEYDSQRELDAVVGQVVGRPFSPVNTVRYVLNEEYYRELLRTVLETRSYHVLWVHDFSGRNGAKEPDRVAWALAVDGYVQAFVNAIQELDRGERQDLPQFFVFLDEHYYRANGSEPVMTFLERLGTAGPPPFKDKDLSERVHAGWGRLRAAIRESSALRRLGAEYVRRRVCVQVVITHPFDPTFLDDIVMRDHTKLALRDVFEENPASGELLLTGLGVGQHYVGTAWEDRSLVVRGTEPVRVKDAARELLVSQGLRPNEIPPCFRPRPYPESFDQTCDSLRAAGWSASVLVATNGTGFRGKSASVLKAALYNLMQPGSLLLAPDSLWTSDFWAAMFVSAALRGCHAVPLAPAADHAPSSALPTLGLMHRTLWVLFRSSEILRESITAAGGSLRVGLYTKEDDVDDMRALVRRMLERQWKGSPLEGWIHDHPEVLDALREELARMETEYPGPVHPLTIDKSHKPHMHLKAQFFASGAALSLFGRTDWRGTIRAYLGARCRQTMRIPGEQIVIGPVLTRGAIPDWPASDKPGSVGEVREASAEPAPAASAVLVPVAAPEGEWGKVVVITTLGSHNEDRRSMLLDGEVLSATAGPDCLPAMIDFAFLMGAATWPQSVEELDASFPETRGLLRSLSRWLRDMI